MAKEVKRRNYEELGLPVGPYVHCVRHNGLLFLSGLTAFGTDAQDGPLEEQTKAIFNQISFIANKEGTNLANIVSVVIHVVDIQEISGLRRTLLDIYGTEIPASTLVEVSQLFSPELKLEITATIAV